MPPSSGLWLTVVRFDINRCHDMAFTRHFVQTMAYPNCHVKLSSGLRFGGFSPVKMDDFWAFVMDLQ
jgi:hypothetical protein